MEEFLNWFLFLPIGVKFSILLIVPLIIWCLFGRLIMKLISIIPYIIKRIIVLIYLLLEIPISALHKIFGQSFYKIDQGLSNWFNNLSSLFERIYKFLYSPKNLYKGKAVVIFLIISAYLIIPSLIGINNRPFTFWNDFYLKIESAIIDMIIKR